MGRTESSSQCLLIFLKMLHLKYSKKAQTICFVSGLGFLIPIGNQNETISKAQYKLGASTAQVRHMDFAWGK